MHTGKGPDDTTPRQAVLHDQVVRHVSRVVEVEEVAAGNGPIGCQRQDREQEANSSRMAKLVTVHSSLPIWMLRLVEFQPPAQLESQISIPGGLSEFVGLLGRFGSIGDRKS